MTTKSYKDPEFPLDDATLVMLAAACKINPDSGHSELMRFLDMGSQVKSSELIDGEEGEDGAVYFVEYEEGYEPFSPHAVIGALVGEIFVLRGPLKDIGTIAKDARFSDEYLGNYVRAVLASNLDKRPE